jgi:hypothetical protein
VLRAMRAEKSVGSAIASSKLFGVQRLGAAEYRGQRLDRGADDVVVGVLLGQADPRRLAMSPQHFRAVVLGPELGHDPVPQRPRCAELRDPP